MEYTKILKTVVFGLNEVTESEGESVRTEITVADTETIPYGTQALEDFLAGKPVKIVVTDEEDVETTYYYPVDSIFVVSYTEEEAEIEKEASDFCNIEEEE